MPIQTLFFVILLIGTTTAKDLHPRNRAFRGDTKRHRIFRCNRVPDSTPAIETFSHVVALNVENVHVCVVLSSDKP